MTDYSRPEWVTVEWLDQQRWVEWVDGDGDRWEAQPYGPVKWEVRRVRCEDGYRFGPFYEDAAFLFDMMGVCGVESLTVSNVPPTPTGVTVTRDQLRRAIIKAGPANPLRLLDELWAHLGADS